MIRAVQETMHLIHGPREKGSKMDEVKATSPLTINTLTVQHVKRSASETNIVQRYTIRKYV